ncbi:MAG: winged helix-turn-helix transcriptional regulator [Bacteroidaceae bacterium]|nr:winged helix-turn-helix transcriptional regulator [Bacteroidaceae bacterium]
MRKMFKYTPLYANGKEPIIEEQDVYRIEIPYIPTLQTTETESGLKSGLKSRLKTTQEKILSLIEENPNITYAEIVETLGMARSGIAKQIRQLQLIGRIKRVGPDKGGHWEIVEE